MDLGRGSPSGTTTDDERWADAQSLLDRAPTPGAEQRLRRHRTVAWSLVAGGLVVAAAVGLLIGVLVSDDGSSGPDVPAWRDVASLVVVVVGMVVEIVGVVVAVRAGLFRNVWRQPALVLTRAQRRSLLRQVRGKDPVDPARLPLARGLATQLALQTAMVGVYVGLVVMQIGQAIGSPSTARLAFATGLVVLYVVVLVLLRRQARQAQRFLDQHPEPAGQPA